MGQSDWEEAPPHVILPEANPDASCYKHIIGNGTPSKDVPWKFELGILNREAHWQLQGGLAGDGSCGLQHRGVRTSFLMSMS